MTKDNNPYIQQMNSEPTTDDPLYDDLEGEEITEGFLRGLSAIAMINKLKTLGKQVKSAKTTDKKIELLADQNLTLGKMVFAMTLLPPKKK